MTIVYEFSKLVLEMNLVCDWEVSQENWWISQKNMQVHLLIDACVHEGGHEQLFKLKMVKDGKNIHSPNTLNLSS